MNAGPYNTKDPYLKGSDMSFELAESLENYSFLVLFFIAHRNITAIIQSTVVLYSCKILYIVLMGI